MAGAGNQNYRNQHDATDDRTELILSFHWLESRLQTSRFTIQERLVARRDVCRRNRLMQSWQKIAWIYVG